MIRITTFNENTSYTLNLGTISSISDGTTTYTANINVAMGGISGNDGNKNNFGMGFEGYRTLSGVARSGSGYGSGGGGDGYADGYGSGTGTSEGGIKYNSGGGGGFDPNAYYGLPRKVFVPAGESNPIPGVPANSATLVGRPPALFLLLNKPWS